MQDSAIEEWRAVPGYEGLYEISSWGRVRSLDRTVTRSNGTPCKVRGRIRKTHLGTNGYPGVGLYRGGLGTRREVHVLVAEAFIGPRPEGLDIMHADDNPANNHLSNLSYGTREENMRQCVDRGRNHAWNTHKTHCPAGHEYAGDNLRLTPQGHRVCRTCKRSQKLSYRARRTGSVGSCAISTTRAS